MVSGFYLVNGGMMTVMRLSGEYGRHSGRTKINDIDLEEEITINETQRTQFKVEEYYKNYVWNPSLALNCSGLDLI